MKAHFKLFYPCDSDLIISLITLGTIEALIITLRVLKKRKKLCLVYSFIYRLGDLASKSLSDCLRNDPKIPSWDPVQLKLFQKKQS